MFSILLSRVDRVIPRSSSGCCADICGAKRHDFEAGAWRNCMAKFMTVFLGQVTTPSRVRIIKFLEHVVMLQVWRRQCSKCFC